MPYSDPAFIHPLLGAEGAWSGYHVEFAPGALNLGVLAQLHDSPWSTSLIDVRRGMCRRQLAGAIPAGSVNAPSLFFRQPRPPKMWKR